MGCLVSKNKSKDDEEGKGLDSRQRSGSSERGSSSGSAMKAALGMAMQNGSIRGSFRKSTLRLKVKWGVEAHSVNSEARKRRLSDQSLAMVMENGPIHEAFLAFMRLVQMEAIVLAWKELDLFDKMMSGSIDTGGTAEPGSTTVASTGGMKPNDRRKKALERANEIYKRFFAENMNEKLCSFLSTSTMKDLQHDLMVDAEGRVNQHNIFTLHEVFKVIHLRIHNVLKYEYLPGFLASEQFFQLATSSTGDQASAMNKPTAQTDSEPSPSQQQEQVDGNVDEDVVAKARGESASSLLPAAHDEDVSDLVLDAEKSRFFFEFIFKEARSLEHIADPSEARSRRISLQEKMQVRQQSQSLLKQLNVVELFLEVEDLLDTTTSPDAKLKRLNLILARYATPGQDLLSPPLKSLDALYRQLDIASSPLKAFPDGFDLVKACTPVKEEVLRRIQRRIVPAFKRSNTYRLMQLKSRHSTLGVSTAKELQDLAEFRKQSATATKDPLLAALERDPLLQDVLPSTSMPIRSKSENSSRPLSKYDTAPDQSMSQQNEESASSSPALSSQRTASHVEALNKFKEDVQVGPKHFSTPFVNYASSKVTLDEVLGNSYGILQLKRFARRMFQEENILFLVEVDTLRKNIQVSSREDVYELLHRAQSICTQYVQTGSPLEINISDPQRQETMSRFGSCFAQYVQSFRSTTSFDKASLGTLGEDHDVLPVEATTESQPESTRPVIASSGSVILETQFALLNQINSIFDLAEREVKSMVQKGLWESFQSDKLFADYVEKKGFFHLPHSSVPNGGAIASPKNPPPPTVKA